MSEGFKRTDTMAPSGGSPSLLARARGVWRRLNSPEDTQAALAVAAALLCADAALCLLVIARVPCA